MTCPRCDSPRIVARHTATTITQEHRCQRCGWTWTGNAMRITAEKLRRLITGR